VNDHPASHAKQQRRASFWSATASTVDVCTALCAKRIGQRSETDSDCNADAGVVRLLGG
jgi:hypothetical protein